MDYMTLLFNNLGDFKTHLGVVKMSHNNYL